MVARHAMPMCIPGTWHPRPHSLNLPATAPFWSDHAGIVDASLELMPQKMWRSSAFGWDWTHRTRTHCSLTPAEGFKESLWSEFSRPLP